MSIEPSTHDVGTAEAAYDRLQAALRRKRDRQLGRTATTPVPTPWQSVCRLGRELRAYGRAWLRSHRIGYAAGYVDGYLAGLAAAPRRSA